MLQVKSRFQDSDPLILQGLGHGPENLVILADLDPVPQGQTLDIGPDILENSGLGDGAEEHRFLDPFVGGKN